MRNYLLEDLLLATGAPCTRVRHRVLVVLKRDQLINVRAVRVAVKCFDGGKWHTETRPSLFMCAGNAVSEKTRKASFSESQSARARLFVIAPARCSHALKPLSHASPARRY